MKAEDINRIFRASASAPTAALKGEPPFSTRPELIGTFGMVASSHWLASSSGMRILENGGNAFDAAAATTFALQVIEPTMCGVGGEAPMIFCDAKTEQIHVISGQGTAPAMANVAAYQGLGLDVVPGAGLCFPRSASVRYGWGVRSVVHLVLHFVVPAAVARAGDRC